LLGNRAGAGVNLISVSADPIADTPERLKAWSEKFGAGPGWTLLTGPKAEVDRLLKILGAFTPDKQDHSPMLLIGNDATGEWTHVSGLAPPAKIAEVISTLQPTAAQKYFTDVELIDQDGRRVRLYSDLLKGKVVVINTFFTTCDATCPMLAAGFAKIQKWLGDRLGKDVYLISISVDPETDTPPRLKEYAAKFNAHPGWFFLTGDKKNVDFALEKFGQVLEKKNDHLNLFYIGNEKTGLWKKAFGLANGDELIKVVESVMNDQS
jgi:cytochrome oxidase Cu insertion factor (SCO1/SenC/PrrC family)